MSRRATSHALAALVAVAAALVGALAGASPAEAETVRQAQWHLDAVDAIRAQQLTRGSGVTVAVIDTGVYAAHPDLTGQVLAGTGMLGSSSVDGRDDPYGHGTQVASLIASKGGGVNRSLGIAPEAKILPIALPPDTLGKLSGPIRYAVDHGASIINLSLGFVGDPKPDDVAAVRYARSKGVIVVAAAGNKAAGDTVTPSPANIPGVIAVSGTDRSGGAWDGDVEGKAVAVSAPALQIVAAGSPSNPKTGKSGYAGSSGTSEATAIVSGVLALIRSKFPSLDANNVINRLFKTAVDKGPAGRDTTFGYGLVNAYAALTANIAPTTTDPLPVAAAGNPTGSDPATTKEPIDDGPGTPLTRVAFTAVAGVVLLTGLVLLVRRAGRRSRPRPYGYGAPPGPGTPPGPGGPPPGWAPPTGPMRTGPPTGPLPTGPMPTWGPPTGPMPGGPPTGWVPRPPAGPSDGPPQYGENPPSWSR